MGAWMRTVIIRKYTIFGTSTKVYALSYRGKNLVDPVNANDKEALGKLFEYAVNCGFTTIKFIDSSV